MELDRGVVGEEMDWRWRGRLLLAKGNIETGEEGREEEEENMYNEYHAYHTTHAHYTHTHHALKFKKKKHHTD